MSFTPPLAPADRLDPGRPVGMVWLGMGGPDGPDSVAPFLYNLFADPMVLPLPAWLSRPVGKLIVRRRLADVTARYAGLGHGGGSPQLEWTWRQARRTAALLASRSLTVTPVVAMRYWKPFTETVVADLAAAGVDQVLAVPTYPQYSAATTGSSLAELARHVQPRRWPLHVVRQWPLLDGYVETLAAGASEPLARWCAAGVAPERCALVLTAHSLPERFVRGGDPYVRQTRATARAMHARLRTRLAPLADWVTALAAGGSAPCLAFQSKVGPVRWVGPATADVCLDLVRGGVTHLAVAPLSFACEHIETLDELDRELQAEVREVGASEFARAPALNLSEAWLASLADHLAVRAFGLAPLVSGKEDRR